MAYIGFGSILEMNGKFQWRIASDFPHLYIAGLMWYGGGWAQ